MTIELKKELIDFENLANSVQKIKQMLEKLVVQLEEQVVTPLIEQSKAKRLQSVDLLNRASKIMRFVNNISSVIYRLTRITALIDKQWTPKSAVKVPSEDYLLNYIRYMHKCGKLDFTV